MKKPGEVYFPGLLLFLFSFGVLILYSVSPTVYSGDSSLLSAASYYLGSAHPPGYPLYLLFGKLFSFLPFGNVAFRMNLMSAFFGAMTALTAYECAFYLAGRRLAGLLAPAALLASPSFVLESSKAEVYTLNAFVIMLVSYFCLRALREKDAVPWLLLSSFVLGLGMGNHHTAAFTLPLLVYAAILRRKSLSPGIIAACPAVFLVGFSVCFSQYLRTTAGAFLAYNEVHSLSDFITVFFRLQYSGSSIDAAKSALTLGTGWIYAARNLVSFVSGEIHPVMWALVLSGLAGFYREKKIFFYLILALAVWLPLARMTMASEALTYRHASIVSPYFLQLLPLTAVVGAAGLSTVFDLLRRRSPLVSKYAVALLVLFQVFSIPAAFQKSSLRDYSIAYTWYKDVAKILSPKSFYLTYSDNPGFLSLYFNGVERLRDDVFSLHGSPEALTFKHTMASERKYSVWYPEIYGSGDTPARNFSILSEQGRLFSSSFNRYPEGLKEKFRMEEHVLVTRLLPPDKSYPLDENFRRDFAKVNYLPIVNAHKKDVETRKLNEKYAHAIWRYAGLLESANENDRDYYYRLAFYLSDGNLKYFIMKDYLAYLADGGRKPEAQVLLASLKGEAEGNWKLAVEKLDETFTSQYGGEEAAPNELGSRGMVSRQGRDADR